MSVQRVGRTRKIFGDDTPHICSGKNKGWFALSVSIPVEQLSHDILSFFYSNCVNGNSYVSQFRTVALLLRELFSNVEMANVEYEISRINEYFLMKLEKPVSDR